MHTIDIRQFPIELFKVMQIAGFADSGGQAKHIIGEGLVLLNGVVETQKRKKCQLGDVVTFSGNSVELSDEARS